MASTSGSRFEKEATQPVADSNETGHASIEDLGSGQRGLLATAVDTAILKVHG